VKLDEVDQSPEIRKAGEIVQKMYNKLNQMMHWADDSKPTIRGLVKELDNPFLNHITKDLETFTHYGQLWVDCDGSNIFSKSTQLPTYDDIMKDPDYHKEQKLIDYNIVSMYPSSYAIHCKQGFQGMEGDFSPQENLVFEYAMKVLDGSKMPMPYLRYELYVRQFTGSESIGFSQEGRHRATVAELLNAHKIPCMVVTQVEHQIEKEKPGSLDEFTGMMRQKFK